MGDGRFAALIEEQAFPRAAAVEQHMIEGDAGEFHPRRDLVADRVACLQAVLACDDRRPAAGRYVEVAPEERESRRGHGRRRGDLDISEIKRIEPGNKRDPMSTS